MCKKHHGGPAPVPPGNQRQTGPGTDSEFTPSEAPAGADFNEQDPKRRLGGYATAGEHSRQQPGALNDGGSASRKG
ncbi:hypothetical protein [Urbifossiella limnaea]|uniref:Uncharacterized protein n=1 Tax=Urbifossiella limnaea TaxID=2528023 RepID=A0A517XX82_9BACT|nr:hypothetical protein [Urbifossiella limnaea]QDU22122.1 hypothetical protein ETAA1_40980 [Urbifossiella limnaea]